ncbi:uncharacterized protein LOC108330531 [Vigna angularis]|uniref:uncharacterized protein LOC108330531 n=1 Tax=Phaseolus angularis TaxID=3914 RepID=UPI000809A1AC|nr:uncharacterized protein LOC108330531 [Vigna angularis]
MSKDHSCYSSTCNVGRKENPNVCSPICHCGLRCALRIAKTMKNRDKQFWGCSKYKSGTEDSGCNYFRWCTDVAEDERGTWLKSEGNKESLLNSEEMDSNMKMVVKLDKFVFIVEKWMKVLQHGMNSSASRFRNFIAAKEWKHGMPVIAHFLHVHKFWSKFTTNLSPAWETWRTSNSLFPDQL